MIFTVRLSEITNFLRMIFNDFPYYSPINHNKTLKTLM